MFHKPCVHLGLQDYFGLTKKKKAGEISLNRFCGGIFVHFHAQQTRLLS